MSTPVPDAVKRLVDHFDRNRDAYHSVSYNEAQLRREFIDPLFEALGWDVENRQGSAMPYRDVIFEDSLKVGGATKAPDYCFRIGGMRKFFVEAKKPSVNIAVDAGPAFQLRRYAWSAKLPLSILTDFEEFAVYDCRSRPVRTDKASTARIKLLRYSEYPDRWDELCSVFSPEAIRKGSFDKYVVDTKVRKGTAEVDDAFLAEIEGWRDSLARNIALRNPRLGTLDNTADLNLAVQMTIDRAIFLRICEDRGIEDYGTLQNLIGKPGVYRRLMERFEDADKRYNSGLFDFRKDTVTPSLKIDDKLLSDILSELYPPKSPYEFSVIGIEILGEVYEQFLGKVIRLTAGHQAKVEEKPEVRKAGGVHYTPQYIVSYIVKNTIGKLIAGKTPAEIEKLAFLDKSCGSGSFLIGGYTCLLDYHLDWYVRHDPAKHPNEVFAIRPGEYLLTTAEKKRILLNNIYGVDIDPQAVEVTKLSLLLKVLEGENKETINQTLRLFRERALPNLDSNIKCGNSLIDSDFYRGQQGGLFDADIRRVNAFDWHRAFPEVMARGGFDADIGNPPWGAEFSIPEQQYLRQHFQTATGRGIDSYAVFIEQGLAKLRAGGLLGFITPDTFLRKDDHLRTRKLLLSGSRIDELVETGPVFSAVRDTWGLVFVVSKSAADNRHRIRHKKISRFIVSAEERLAKFGHGDWDEETTSSQSTWLHGRDMVVGYRATDEAQRIVAKMAGNPALGELHAQYIVSRGEEGSKFALREHKAGSFRMVIPADVERYAVADGMRVTESSLTESKVRLLYTHPKIWCIRIQKLRWKQRIVSGLDTRTNTAGMKTLQAIVSTQDNVAALGFLQGILASKLVNFWCINFLADDMNQSYLEKLPIPRPDKARHDKMVELVTRMMELKKQQARAPKKQSPSAKQLLDQKLAITDQQIDALVYELYGLTEEEIRIVEGAGR